MNLGSDGVTPEMAATVAEAPADRPEIRMTRTFDAPREMVFDAWTDAETLDQWWGPDGFRNSTHDFAFREGGAWVYTMHGPDGTDYPNHVRYLEIDPPARIVYDHGETVDGPALFQVTVTFVDEGDRTTLEMRSVFPSLAARDAVLAFGALEGGQQTLARLAAYLAGR